MNIPQPFYVDPHKPGCIRGGFFDEMGGMLVGMHAKKVCDALNDHEPLREAAQFALNVLTGVSGDERDAIKCLEQVLK